MAAQIDERTLGGSVAGGSNNSQGANNQASSGGSLTQGGAGAAALAQLMIYEIMATYSKIIKLDQKQKANMVEAQSAATSGEADATRSAGEQAMIFAIIGASLSVVGAGLTMFAAAKIGSSDIDKADQNMTSLGAGKGRLSELETLSSDPAQTPQNLSSDPAITNRAEQLKNGEFNIQNKAEKQYPNKFCKFLGIRGKNVVTEDTIYGKTQIDDDTKAAIGHLKASDDTEGYAKFRTSLTRAQDQNVKEFNSEANNAQRGQTKSNTLTQPLNSLVQMSSSVTQGIGRSAEANYNAQATIGRTSAQMAGSESSAFDRNASQAVQQQNGEVQVLERIQQSQVAAS